MYPSLTLALGSPSLFASLSNSNRQQLKMYLVSIKRNPKSVLKNVKNGILINFLKDNPSTFEEDKKERKKEIYKVELELFTLDKNENLKLLDKLNLESI